MPVGKFASSAQSSVHHFADPMRLCFPSFVFLLTPLLVAQYSWLWKHPIISHLITPNVSKVWFLSYLIKKKSKTRSKCGLLLPLVCDLVKLREEDLKRFLQFFHFVQGSSCQSHNGLISSRPSWRQWGGFGLVQELWFGLGICGLESAEQNHLFWRAFLLYASHMHVLSAFLREEGAYTGACRCISWYPGFCICCPTASNHNGERGTGSLFCFDNKPDLVSALCSHPLPLSLTTLRPFSLLIIKSYHSPVPWLCLNHLCLCFNHCHIAPVFSFTQLTWGSQPVGLI